MKRLGLLGVVLAACLCGCCGGLRAQDTIRMTGVKRLWLDWRTAGDDADLMADVGNERQTIRPETTYEFDDTVSITLYCPTSLLSLNTGRYYPNYSRLLSLDVSGCPALDSLDCLNAGLTSLDVSHNRALTYLRVGYGSTSLTSLDVSQNGALAYLGCGGSNLVSLDLSHNAALMYLDFGANKLTSLDLSHNA
ncbi:MAG: hypothetical protein K2H65_01355, partial [Bacteroidales bacterium]|nr:hypothetical protein [Bacteroidales bacterium]